MIDNLKLVSDLLQYFTLKMALNKESTSCFHPASADL